MTASTNSTPTRRCRTALAALALILASASAAKAGDICMKYELPVGQGNTIRYLWVAKALRVPGPGRCKPVNGIIRESLFAYPFLSPRARAEIVGTACTTSDGSTLRVLWSEMNDVHETRSGRAELPLPLGPWGAGAVSNVTQGFSMRPTPCDQVDRTID